MNIRIAGLIAGLCFCFQAFHAQDILTLKNEKAFYGKTLGVAACDVIFAVEDSEYAIPFEDVLLIQLAESEEVNNAALMAVLRESKSNCYKAKVDADLYHGKTAKHIAFGFLFGVFAVAGAAISSPHPVNGKETVEVSQNQDLFSDPEYLQCYKKEARGNNVNNTLLGWGVWLIIVLATL